ncbi:hypothetical protein Pint_29182 [Pistacia integerrima]|uniref:Uncharacterized protein n=1 Tax=Pistacia integerrima TaxID=434235 RepID=A0ACC0WZ03_9ROSI|nr:hypothetical protein Pint_29182 [Pistacia integerrima]
MQRPFGDFYPPFFWFSPRVGHSSKGVLMLIFFLMRGFVKCCPWCSTSEVL